MIDSIDAECLERLRGAVATARARAWKLGVRPAQTVIDVDATLTGAHSEKEQAAGNFKGGYGHHPLLCYLDATGEALAGILRAGNAGSNTAIDHTVVLDLALEQPDEQALQGEILVRIDGAGASHEVTAIGGAANEAVRRGNVAPADGGAPTTLSLCAISRPTRPALAARSPGRVNRNQAFGV